MKASRILETAIGQQLRPSAEFLADRKERDAPRPHLHKDWQQSIGRESGTVGDSGRSPERDKSSGRKHRLQLVNSLLRP
jgi:hypothetical protein